MSLSKFKALGLALVVVVATSAVAASSATAVNFKSESAKTFLAADTATENILSFWGVAFKCKTVGVKNGASFSPAEVASIETEPVYGGCAVFGQVTTVDTNGCKYKLVASSTTTGTTSIVCPEGKEIAITLGDPGVICTIKIKAQTPKSPTVDYTSGETGEPKVKDLTVTSTVSGIAYTSSGGFCGTSGPVGGYTGASFTGSFKLTGFSTEGHATRTGISVV
jgi:hypothetical protein